MKQKGALLNPSHRFSSAPLRAADEIKKAKRHPSIAPLLYGGYYNSVPTPCQ